MAKEKTDIIRKRLVETIIVKGVTAVAEKEGIVETVTLGKIEVVTQEIDENQTQLQHYRVKWTL